MIISDENYFPILIDNIEVPTKTDMFWILDMEERDFMLTPLYMFEEQTTNVLIVNIFGYVLELPAHWNMLVFSEETSQLDILEISEISRGHFTSFVMNHSNNRIVPGLVSVVDYRPYHKIRTVSLNKNAMLCHPLGNSHWVCVSPTDNYNKYLKDAVVGDLIC